MVKILEECVESINGNCATDVGPSKEMFQHECDQEKRTPWIIEKNPCFFQCFNFFFLHIWFVCNKYWSSIKIQCHGIEQRLYYNTYIRFINPIIDYSTREHTTFSLIIVFGLEIMRKGSRCTSCSAKIPCQSGKLYRNTLYLWVHIKYCSSFADVRGRRKKGKRVLIEDEVQRQHWFSRLLGDYRGGNIS